MLANLGTSHAETNLPPVLTNPSDCGLNLFITEAGCGPSNEFQVNVATAPGTSLGGNVYLKELRFIIEHGWAADLDIFLKSPAGVMVEVSTDNGDAFDNYGDPADNTCSQFTTFAAHAVLNACNLPSIMDGDAPFIGTYLPEGNFSDFNNGSSPIGLWTLVICDDGASNLGHLQFVELVFESTACVTPTEVTVMEEDSTAVLLDWVTGSTCDNILIEYGPIGFTPGTGAMAGVAGTVAVGGCPPYLLTGLQPSTAYQFYLRENCGSNNYSNNACPVQAMTTCSPPPATIHENFNSQQLCQPLCGITCPVVGTWRNASNDNFDWLVNTDTTLTALTGPPGDNPGGGNYLYLEASGASCRNGKRAVLVSNCIQVVANPDTCDMSFDYNFNGVHINGMSFEVSTDGGQTWAILWNASGNKGPAWRKQFVDLDAYSGMTCQFRFVGRGGNGQFADLALDNILFYGSIDLGFPDFVYYQDNDGDGFGNSAFFIASCQPASFPGYVANDDDCDDLDFFVNPGMEEVLCDDFDSNCNGDMDEYFVEAVTIENQLLCNGASGFVVAFPNHGGQISWYDSLSGGQIIAVGDTLFPDPADLVNNGLDTLVLRFFAEELTQTGCVSNERTEANITIYPSPRLSTTDQPGDCFGKIFDLSALNILDESGLNGNLSYYDQLPLTPANQVGPTVTPTTTTTYFVLSEATNGCRDTLPVVYTVQPGPVAQIPNPPTICRQSSAWISVADIGTGTGPFTYAWNTGQDSVAIQIFSDNIIGSVQNYAVTITDVGGCYSADTLVVTTIENIQTLLTNSTDVTTCNGSDGSLSVMPLDGNPPFTYEWSGGVIANQPGELVLTGLQQGSYSLTVTDSSPEQCRAVVPTVVVNGPAAIVTVGSVINVSCFGESDGCINLNVMGGPNTQVAWSNGMQGANICGLAAGEYTATITEGNCENVISIPITQPEALLVNLEQTPVSCHGGSDGELRLNIFGGSPPISYAWSNGINAPVNTNLTAGFYDLTVTDVNGCQISLDSIEVTQASPISLANISLNQPNCFGESNGSISVEGVGGSQPFAFAWSNGGAGSSINNIAVGNYTITLTDQKGCTFSQTIALAQPPQLDVVSDGIQMPSCAGLENGFIQTEVSGGVGAYFFLWNTGATTPDLANIGNGTYGVTVTDDNGCTTTRQFDPINSPSLLSATINQTTPTFCIGRDENCLEVSVTGGMPPYDFIWNTDEEGQSLCFLPSGFYEVTVEDNNGCQTTISTVIDSLQVLTLGYQAFSPLCYGQTGQLAITIAGGMSPYQVNWSNGQNGIVANNLLAENHSATVTDANGCTNYLDIITLTEPDSLVTEIASLDGIPCFGGNEGAINLTTHGGTWPYQFQWSNGAQTEDLNGLPSGNYSVVVTDDNGCTANIQGIGIVAPDKLNPQADLDLPTSNCQSLQVDELCINMQGGVGPYRFLWDNSDTTQCLASPPPGDYHVTITDAEGCTVELMSVKVPEEYSAILLQPLEPQAIVCQGDSTGQVGFTIVGGVGPFQFNWSNGHFGQTSAATLSISNLPTGSYQVTTTDNTGCTAVSPVITVSSFGQVLPTINTNQVRHVTCKFGADGFIPLSVTGGQGPYGFYWENDSGMALPGGPTLGDLTAGTYFATVTDQLGCTGTASTTIWEPDTELLLQNAVIQHITCHGDSNGSILALPTGGELPYQYHWQSQGPGNGAFTPSIEQLPLGAYHLSVTDDNGCTRTASYFITGPEDSITVQVLDSAGVLCFGGSDGFLDISIFGGTPGYSVNWNNFSAEEDLTQAPAGQYLLSVFDSLGCHLMQVYHVGTPPPLFIETVTVQDQTQVHPPNGAATVIPDGGTPPYSYEWTTGSMSQTISNMAAGIYGVTVTDHNDCETVTWVQIKLMTATDDPAHGTGFVLSPNPTTGEALLQCPGHLSQPLELQVFNPLGQLVLLRNSPAQHSPTIPLDLSGQAPGLYHLRVSMAGVMVYEGKMVVVR